MAPRRRERNTVGRGRFGAQAVSSVTALALSVVLLLSASGAALAKGDDGEGGPRGGSPQRAGVAAIPPGANPEAARKAYMALLFQEINLRRDRAGSPRYEYMADAGSEAVDAYLRDLLPAMVDAHSCFHGSDREGMRAGWDYLGDVGIDEGKVGGEVLACPDTSEGGFWTPPGIADGWWKSPHHFATLYADRRPAVIACGADVPIKGGLAYETVACITLMGEK
jgi:hypothetical protein